MTRSTAADEDQEGKTEIIQGVENVINLDKTISQIRERLDTCLDSNGVSSVATGLQARLERLKERGVRLRYITEVTRENIQHCKKLMNAVELRHLQGIRGNFGVADGVDFRASSSVKPGQPPTEIIRSTAKQFVEQQQYFFDMLWEKAIPADQRIKEIEEGIGPEFIETIKDPNKVLKLGYDLLKEAKSEVLLIFSSANAFLRQKRAGLILLLTKMAEEHGIQIRIMTPIDDRIKKTIERFQEPSLQQKIEVKNIEPPLQTRVTLLIVDRKYSLAVELKDDAKETSLEAMGMATYSNSKATVLSYTSIFESLWNQAELYERIKQLYEQLKVHSEMQKEFISIAAHELRTPIQPIIGLTEILNQKEGNSSEYHQLLEIINRNANRLNRLTETLLDVARIESQSLRLNKETLDLNDTIIEAINDIEKSSDNNKVTLSFLRQEKDVDFFVNADRGRITQVIHNLLSNAIKFAEGRTVTVTLGKESNDDGKFAIISVRDSGSGIDPEIVPRLFTKFASKSEKGTGLGLFISKGIVEAHCGKIWAKNNNKQEDGGSRGATFAFSLPLASKHPD